MIKTKTITTDKATLLVVELPEMVKDAVVTTFNRIGFYLPNGIISYEMLPEGNWQLLGRLPDITEGYVYELIPEVITPIMGFKAYPNFDKDGYCKTALESLLSLLQANDVYFENSLGDEPKYSHYNYGNAYPSPSERKRFERNFQDWHEAQSKVWDKERTYIFIKVD